MCTKKDSVVASEQVCLIYKQKKISVGPPNFMPKGHKLKLKDVQKRKSCALPAAAMNAADTCRPCGLTIVASPFVAMSLFEF